MSPTSLSTQMGRQEPGSHEIKRVWYTKRVRKDRIRREKEKEMQERR